MLNFSRKYKIVALMLVIFVPMVATAGEAECEAAIKKADAEVAEKTKSPPPAGVVPSMERVMWMTKYMIDAIDASPSCAGDPKAASLRQELENSSKVAETNCKSLATRPCVAQAY